MDKTRDSRTDEDKGTRARRQIAFSLSFLLTSLLGLWLFQEFVVNPLLIQAREIPYSEFRAKARAGDLVEVVIAVRESPER